MGRMLACTVTIIWILLGAVELVQAEARPIYSVTVADAIGPGVAEFLADALQKATQDNAAGIVILLDTPGGVVESTRRIVQAIFACRAPVFVYVWPSGARAASAGVMITMAADVAAMAPGTHIGAAHPVGIGGGDLGETSTEKITNDMVAFARGIADRNGRNADWAEKAVRESVSITAQEALDLNVIDLIAADMDDLLGNINGRSIQSKGRLDLDTTLITPIKQSLRTKILKTISDPNITYILFLIGLAGLYFELSNPGLIFPGVVGGVSLILALFGFQNLPVNTAGILLILLAVVFFILELKIASSGLLSVAGVITLLLGTLMLYKGAGPQYRVAWQVLIPTVALISFFFIFIASLVVRAQVHQPMTGADGLVGETGIVKTTEGLEGRVLVHGEIWQAVFTRPVAAGDKVVVEAVENLVITAGPIGEKNKPV